MVLELHIWGPAFGLPSLDPQCLAAVAYFALTLRSQSSRDSDQNRAASGEWVLIADSDPLMVPTHELPAVRVGLRWVSGFRNIVEFLKQYSNGEWDLDKWMEKKEWADCMAFSSFVESHGQPLIDLSLYVSSENYKKATMRAYTPILQWPNQWVVPPKIRAIAKQRTEHLGLSGLDIDVVEEEQKQSRESHTAAAQIPERFATRRETTSSVLSKMVQQNWIRLEGMTEAFVTPLEEFREKKKYLLSEEFPSSLDCLALGYLSLAVVPDLPYPWLCDAIQAKTPGLVSYVKRLQLHCFGGSVDVSTALSLPYSQETKTHTQPGLKHHHDVLPWQAPEQLNLAGSGLRMWNMLLDSIPIVGDVRASQRLQKAGQEMPTGVEHDMVVEVARAQRYNSYMSVGTVVGGLGLLTWYMFSAGLLAFGVEEEDEDEEHGHWHGVEKGESSSDWGEAGSMLGI